MAAASDSIDPRSSSRGRLSVVAAVAVGMLALTILMLAMLALALSPSAARAQTQFQIVWVVIGEAATADGEHAARAGRQLFLASDLLSMSLDNVKVSRVDVAPTVVEVAVGKQLCLSQLSMRAFGPDQRQVDGAPLSVAVRQDHRQQLRLKRSRRDICVRPADAGEYPVRLTSMLPAPDGTKRGAQVFLRAKDPSPPAQNTDTNRLQSRIARALTRFPVLGTAPR